MPFYLVIETDQGLTVVEHDPRTTPEETAVSHGGVVADPDLYKTFDDAYDAMLLLRDSDEDGQDELP